MYHSLFAHEHVNLERGTVYCCSRSRGPFTVGLGLGRVRSTMSGRNVAPTNSKSARRLSFCTRWLKRPSRSSFLKEHLGRVSPLWLNLSARFTESKLSASTSILR